MREILSDLDRWIGGRRLGEEVVLATVVGVRRSAPRPPGARLCLTRGGRIAGSVSGGCVEADVFQRALAVLDNGRPEVASYGIADETGFEVGLSCGGEIDVLIEPFAPGAEWETLRRCVERREPVVYAVGLAPEALLGRKLTRPAGGHAVGAISPLLDEAVLREGEGLLRAGGTSVLALPWEGREARVFVEASLPAPSLHIVGATHAAVSLCRLAAEAGFEVTVIDARSALATRERFPDAARIVHAWPEEAMEQAPLDGYSSMVVLTHDPKFDVPALARALRSPARYVGAQGSRVTHEGRKAQLRRLGFGEEDVARIRSPIGLDIGSRTPAELAVSILAEVLAVRYGRG